MKVPWIKFRIQDWQEGTSQLNAIEYALYHKICASIWHECKAVHKSSAPALLAGVSEEDAYTALDRLVLLGKVQIDEAGRCWNQPSVDTYHDSAGRIEIARRGGKESGRVRREQSNGKNGNGKHAAPAEPPPEPEQPELEVPPILEIDRLKMVYPDNGAGPGTTPWRRVAAEIQKNLKIGDTFDEMVAGAQRYAIFCKAMDRIGTPFIYSPINFIRDRLYKGDWEPPRGKMSKPEQAKHEQERIVAELKARYARGT